MRNKKILLVGGGGHCRSVLDCLLRLNSYNSIGIIEREYTSASTIFDIPVIGTDNDLPKLFAEGWTDAFITVGSIGSPSKRQSLFQRIKEIGFVSPTIVDPSAVVSQEVLLGEGTFIGKQAVVNSGSKIGSCVIINTGAIIEHDCYVGAFSHISPGSILCGEVTVGENTHIGAGSIVRQQISIGSNTLIGMGSVVVRNIAANATAFGVPCREINDR